MCLMGYLSHVGLSVFGLKKNVENAKCIGSLASYKDINFNYMMLYYIV